MGILTKKRLNELVPRGMSEEGKTNISTAVSKSNERRKVPVIERFRKMYTVDEKTGCWNWNRGCSNSGYGTFYSGNKPVNPHRWYWQYINERTLPRHLLVCHKCDNRRCVNPNHMFIGTAKDNMQDSTKKGRGRWK